VRLEVLTAVKMSMLLFWVVTPCEPEDGDNKFLRNVKSTYKSTCRHTPKNIDSI
jgi:hypothetical protein